MVADFADGDAGFFGMLPDEIVSGFCAPGIVSPLIFQELLQNILPLCAPIQGVVGDQLQYGQRRVFRDFLQRTAEDIVQGQKVAADSVFGPVGSVNQMFRKAQE